MSIRNLRVRSIGLVFILCGASANADVVSRSTETVRVDPAAPTVNTSELRVKTTITERPAPEPKPWALDGTLELRAARDVRDRPQNLTRQGLYELSLGGRYQFDEALTARVELSLEQINQHSTFFAKQAYVQYRPTAFAGVRLGQQFLPVGLIAPRDTWFSTNPPFYQKLFRGAKPIDLGAVAEVYPLSKLRREFRELAYAEVGTFSGQLVREQDQRVGTPERAPRIASLKSRSEFHDAFLTYVDHDLAFFDPVRAVGLGFEARTPGRWPVRGSLLTEVWDIRQTQRNGPTERTRAAAVYGEVQWWRLRAGYRFARADGRMLSAYGAERLPLERSHLAMAEARIAGPFTIRVERVFARQDEVLADDWVYRALVNVTAL